MTKKSFKWLMVGVLLLIFAGVKVAGVVWWQEQHQVSGSIDVACNVADCTLPNGAVVQITPAPAAKTPFAVRISGLPESVQAVSLSFSMRDMDMGFNRFDLKKQTDGAWLVADVRLPLCSQARKDYFVEIVVDAQVYRVPFVVP